ncbi:NAD(P)/FAD-dependent oxidoreductase [Sulfurospirillum multivorans]|uniref:FAD-dependent dehydrogenase n=2 Tax=Sulfurospirillum multivorans TaxID=66821 RepID=A0AA86AIW4_SULMK|nr:FAD-dependent oxidoreductase [Sulfurospirillum multivorans]AHJ11364.1 putative FAD-dependent dehydrogenase [Sulfurospirillum multivorans DSM 12446]QEH04868.1 putative FAD-dependent dehydrogenase [Sulfurospirillum multivorans]
MEKNRLNSHYDVIIVGSGPAGLGAAFKLAENSQHSILLVEKKKISSGGLRNDCKQNYTYPVGFPCEHWSKEEAEELLKEVASHLNPTIETKINIEKYAARAKKIGVEILSIDQAHVGTDKSSELIGNLIDALKVLHVNVALKTEVHSIHAKKKTILLEDDTRISFNHLILAPGRADYDWLQEQMDTLGVTYSDNIVDIGVRIETKEENYPIVRDYYDPKILFPGKVRTFCTNSGCAHIVREKYKGYYSINGHSLSRENERNNLVNFAMLKTIRLTEPVVSGQQFGKILGEMVMQLSGGSVIMQRVGDFRMGARSKAETFNNDLYDFEPTLKSAVAGDLSLCMPAKILRDIWKSLKMLDTIIPGVLHPSTIIYYPEIKTYSNKPAFINKHFCVKEGYYIIGDGAGTSRGITAAWASGIRAAHGILKENV